MRLSIRARLTVWYVAMLAVGTMSVAGGSWWLSTQSVVSAADISLHARVQGVRNFLNNPRTRLTVEGLRDEFGEYAELTRGEALLEVVNESGVVLIQPAIPGWTSMVPAETPPASGSERVAAEDRMLASLPFRVATAGIEAAGHAYRVTVAAPMGPAYEALNRFHRLLLLLLPAVLALAGWAGFWISRGALAPVDRITAAVQAINVRRLDQRVTVPPADDEIRRLALTFNGLLERLQMAVGDIVRFTGDASHELRTPVALVRTTAELALRRERTPDEYRTALAEVLEHTSRMSVLVDDLLVLARMDAGIEPQHESTFDVGASVAAACQDATVVAKKRNVQIAVATPGVPMVAAGASAVFQRLLLILLDNAIKYSEDGARVDVEVTLPTPDGVTVAVSDRGIGIDEAETPRLFERFYRGARARQHAPDGNGLGLAIARAVAERSGWALQFAPAQVAGIPGGCKVELRIPRVSNSTVAF